MGYQKQSDRGRRKIPVGTWYFKFSKKEHELELSSKYEKQV
jgi:hypothetical protein